jgi:hypothetical protein
MWSMWWALGRRAVGPGGQGPAPGPEDRPRSGFSGGGYLMHEAGRCGFTPERAAGVVRGHTWNDLASAWQLSGAQLTSAPSAERRVALVTLRAAVLDEMEAQDPSTFRAWLASQPLEDRRGRRWGRRS